jgi:hypothetical protein
MCEPNFEEWFERFAGELARLNGSLSISTPLMTCTGLPMRTAFAAAHAAVALPAPRWLLTNGRMRNDARRGLPQFLYPERLRDDRRQGQRRRRLHLYVATRISPPPLPFTASRRNPTGTTVLPNRRPGNASSRSVSRDGGAGPSGRNAVTSARSRTASRLATSSTPLEATNRQYRFLSGDQDHRQPDGRGP